MTREIVIALGVATALVCSGGHAQALPAHQKSNPWFADAAAVLETRLARGRADTARNAILFVGDGMGLSTVTAARILDGQRRGGSGEEGYLAFERFPHTALLKTYNVDAQVPDSAGTMTAMISGAKTDAGVLGLDEDVVRGACATPAGNELVSLLELAELSGRATGIVTTARVTDATPAATYAKSPERNWEDDSDMPPEALAAGCEDIASQLVAFEARLEARYADTVYARLAGEGAGADDGGGAGGEDGGADAGGAGEGDAGAAPSTGPAVDVDGLEVAFGGGRRHFLPAEAAANSADATSDVEGDRTDGRNLVEEWRALYPAGRYVLDRAGFDALGTETAGPVLGLFAESHMRYEADRENDPSGEPSLSEMTGKAIELLSRDGEGYFLVIEGGRIDHAHRVGNAYAALEETIAFASAVRIAAETTDPSDTLILVVADHGNPLTIGGYPRRGNPILGKVVGVDEETPALAADGLPYATLAYANGRGFRDLGAERDADAGYALAPAPGRHDLTAVETTAPGFFQEALVPLPRETHAGEDVALHARGPGAHRARGVLEQNAVFHVIDAALGLLPPEARR